jgi:hypothetical protein
MWLVPLLVLAWITKINSNKWQMGPCSLQCGATEAPRRPGASRRCWGGGWVAPHAVARLSKESRHTAWRDSLKYIGAAGPLFFVPPHSLPSPEQAERSHGVAPTPPPLDPPPPPPNSSGFGWEITHWRYLLHLDWVVFVDLVVFLGFSHC